MKVLLSSGSENIYYQFFCKQQEFVSAAPGEAPELVHFRKQIGESRTTSSLQDLYPDVD